MPSSFSRLRLWFGISALLMIGVVAGFYMYARYRVQRAIHDLPAKLGANIQQNTQGFTYSQSAGGHTIFSISASNAVRYKQGGKAELHNVKIISYGRNSDRLDEITGDDFEYDAQSGDVTAKGKVGIQLQAVEPGTSKPDAPVNKTGSPLHLDTSGLVFNQKTGIAHTSELITFQLPQGSGSAVGATYDSKANTFRLHSGVQLLTSGPKATNLRASSAYYEQERQELTLTDLQAESGVRRLQAQHVLLHLREDNTVSRADASGGVDAYVKGQRSAQLHAGNATFTFGQNNQATSGHLTGGVNWETQGANASHGNAGEVLLNFGPDNQIKSAQLRNHVDLVQVARSGNTSDVVLRNDPVQPAGTAGRGTEFHGDGLDLQVSGGSRLTTATSVGAPEIVLASAATKSEATANPQTGTTVITSSRFQAKFAGDNRISNLTGSDPVKIVSSSPDKPDRISQSRDMVASFAAGKTQTLEQVVQTGNVQIQEDQRSATADRATYNQATDTMALAGNVRYNDASSGSTLTSNSLSMNRATGETTAAGNVKTTYADQKAGQNTQAKTQQASGAMLSPSQPVHVTAQQMLAKSSTGATTFSGSARLWQGGNIVQAPLIEFNRKERTLDAQGQGNARVSTVFVQAEQSGRQVPVDVLADHLHYDDAQGKAIFDGAIVLKSADSTLRAERAVVTLRAQHQQPPAPKAPATKAPSQVQSIDATGNILLQQPGRRALGNRLIYTADDEKFILTGTPASPPSIFDAEHGQVTGVSLTFFNRDDRVLVDSSNSMSITETRHEK